MALGEEVDKFKKESYRDCTKRMINVYLKNVISNYVLYVKL